MKDYDPQKCEDVFDGDGEASTHQVRSVNSYDPNDKIGTGVSALHFVNGKERLSYEIRFENAPTATAPAQVVRIVDTLDAEKLDLSTFQLHLYHVAGKYYNFASQRPNTHQFLDLRPRRNLILKVTNRLDPQTGVFTVDFESLDPVTMQLTTDPLLGFLPANVIPSEGEGGVYFSVMPKASLSSGTRVHNQASIYFDSNPAMVTSVWSNTMDKVAPRSNVRALPALSNDTIIHLSWSGNDDVSGIERYNIFYSTNGSGYRPLLLNTKLTALRFIGQSDSTYSFYSVAVDRVGNTESKVAADTETKIGSERVRIYPNPARETFLIQVESPQVIQSVSLFDLQGRPVPIRYKLSNNQSSVRIMDQVPAGLFLLRIQTNVKLITKKLIFIR